MRTKTLPELRKVHKRHRAVIYFTANVLTRFLRKPPELSMEEIPEEKAEQFWQLAVSHMAQEPKNKLAVFHSEHSPEGELSILCRSAGIMGLNFPAQVRVEANFAKGVVRKVVNGNVSQLYPK